MYNRRCDLIQKAALILLNSRVVVPHLRRWAHRPHAKQSYWQHVALEPGPAPQVGHFLFSIRPVDALFIFNSSFDGKVALELGPGPHVAIVFLSFLNSSGFIELVVEGSGGVVGVGLVVEVGVVVGVDDAVPTSQPGVTTAIRAATTACE